MHNEIQSTSATVTGMLPPGDDFKPAWQNRSGLPPLLPDTPALPPELIPAAIRPWLVDSAERSQVPLEFIAAPAVVALGSLIGRKVAIHPKHRDDWIVTPNLWGVIVGRPSTMKSPAIAEAIKPLRRLAHDAAEAFKIDKAKSEAAAQVLKLRIDSLQAEIKIALKKGDDVKAKQVALADLNAELAESEAHERRYVVNDGTVEKIGELLNQNPDGLLLARDELSGWLRTLDKSGREGDREFYLEGSCRESPPSSGSKSLKSLSTSGSSSKSGSKSAPSASKMASASIVASVTRAKSHTPRGVRSRSAPSTIWRSARRSGGPSSPAR
jgi:hypothetical protein